MKNNTKMQLEECKNYMTPYMNNQEATKELRDMCSYCEMYMGKDHNYKECYGKPCFNVWLAYEYLEWCNSFA